MTLAHIKNDFDTFISASLISFVILYVWEWPAGSEALPATSRPLCPLSFGFGSPSGQHSPACLWPGAGPNTSSNVELREGVGLRIDTTKGNTWILEWGQRQSLPWEEPFPATLWGRPYDLHWRQGHRSAAWKYPRAKYATVLSEPNVNKICFQIPRSFHPRRRSEINRKGLFKICSIAS